MSEKPSGKPQTLSRRNLILGAIGVAGAGVTADLIVKKDLEDQKAVDEKIARYIFEAEQAKKLQQQAAQKALQSTPTPVPQTVEKPNTFTRIGYFREGFNPSELAEFCSMVKAQEDILDKPGKPNNIGISTEKIKIYNEKFRPIVDKIFPLASQAAGLAMFSDPEWRDLFHCLILAESVGNPDAVSPVGAVGLTQVMPVGAMDSVLIVGRKWQKEPDIYGPLWNLVKKSNPVTAKIVSPKDFDPEKIIQKDFKQQNLFDPTLNIALGLVQFLALMNRFNENIGLAISAYNTGSGNTQNAENKYWQLEGNPNVIPTNKPNFIELFKRREELGLKSENNENWVYLPRIFAIYRKIKGPQAFPLAA